MRPAMFVLLWLAASGAAVLVAWQGVNFVDDAVIHPASHFDLVRSSSDVIAAAPTDGETGDAHASAVTVTPSVEAASEPTDAPHEAAADAADGADSSESSAPAGDVSGSGGFAIPTPTVLPAGAVRTPTPRPQALAPTPEPTRRPSATPRPRSTVVPRPSPSPRADATAVPPATPSVTSTPRPGSTSTPTPKPTATGRPTQTPTAKPSARPTPSPSATAAPSPTPAPAQTLTFTLVGGTTSISFSAGGVTVLWASASPGFSADISSSSKGVRVEFRADHGDSRIDAWWSGGPQWTIREDHD